jgi:hypothetical protein
MHRRTFFHCLGLSMVGAALPGSLLALDRQHRITIARLQYTGGNDNPRPGALRRLLQEVDKRTSIEVDTEIPTVAARRDELFEVPLIWWTGDRGFDSFSDEAITSLRAFLLAGGFLFVDSAEGLTDGPFLESVRRELARVFPRREIVNLPRNHTVHQSFYLIDRPVGRIDIAANFQAIFEDERACVLINPNDLLGAVARDTFGQWEFDVIPGGDRQRELAFRLGINVVMYALTVDYKADQVHIPFILRRRRWRVE